MCPADYDKPSDALPGGADEPSERKNLLLSSFLVLTLSLSATVWGWLSIRNGEIRRAEVIFNSQTDLFLHEIGVYRLNYEQTLRGLAANLAVNRTADGKTVALYAGAIEPLDNYAALREIGYAAKGKDGKLRVVQFGAINGKGFLRPGLDLSSNPAIAEAIGHLERGADTAVSGNINGPDAAGKPRNALVLMVMPVRKGTPGGGAQEIVFLTIDVYPWALHAMKTDIGVNYTNISIYDITGGQEGELLYANIKGQSPNEMMMERQFFKSVQVNMGARVWLVKISAADMFSKRFGNSRPELVLAGGAVISLLLFGITWSLGSSRRRAVAMAGQMTSALKLAEEKYHDIFNVAPLGIFVSTLDGKLLEANPALVRMGGFNSAEEFKAAGNAADFYAEPASRDDFVKLLRQSGGETVTFECGLKRRGGDIFTGRINARLAHDGRMGGQVIKGTMEDITVYKKAQDELTLTKETAEEATRLKDKFISLVAHDLRSPFTSVIGLLAVVEGDKSRDMAPESREIVRKVIETSKRMLRMIEDLLSISRIQTGKIVPRRRFLEARTLLAEAIGSVSHMASGKGVEIVNDIQAEMRIFADRGLMLQAAGNVLSNAIKFSRRGSQVTVYSPPGEMDAIAVKDNGVGINAAILPKIFIHEEKTSTVGTAGEQGTGLGLPLTRDIIKAHGGDISAVSEEGKGSEFVMTLPRKMPNVLIVDDEPVVLMLLRQYLSKLDVNVMAAGDVDTAMSILLNTEIHLVITDLRMPGKDGFALIKSINTAGVKPAPVLVLTSDDKMETRDKAFSMGADDFITKPMTANDLIPRARRLIMSMDW
ncbi:MAG: response regulator [Nitrospinae bacterium]|nr:response regulator [Nitrospinota bacterium]